MKFSLEWLKYFLDTDASVAEIAAKLNAIGFEVEGIDDPAEKLAGFVVAEVLTAAPHPAADKLQVLTVDAGPDINGGEAPQVVRIPSVSRRSFAPYGIPWSGPRR